MTLDHCCDGCDDDERRGLPLTRHQVDYWIEELLPGVIIEAERATLNAALPPPLTRPEHVPGRSPCWCGVAHYDAPPF